MEEWLRVLLAENIQKLFESQSLENVLLQLSNPANKSVTTKET
jgi:hypothetical protein